MGNSNNNDDVTLYCFNIVDIAMSKILIKKIDDHERNSLWHQRFQNCNVYNVDDVDRKEIRTTMTMYMYQHHRHRNADDVDTKEIITIMMI